MKNIFILLILLSFGCSNKPEVNENDKFNNYVTTVKFENFKFNEGKKVVIITNLLGCGSCVGFVFQFIQEHNYFRDISYIFSTDKKSKKRYHLDELIKTVKNDVIVDLNSNPYKKGLVSVNPHIYFLENGKVIKDVVMISSNIDEVFEEITDYINPNDIF